MAISLKAAGTWARIVTDPSSVTIPGTPAAGDRMYLFVTWKTFSITVADPSGWTSLGSFADGAVAAGNGTGSVKVQGWYRDWQSGDGNPSVDWSAAPTEGHAVVMLWQKAGDDEWDTPAVVTAAIAAADPFSATASATVDVPDGSVVMCLVGLRDDSTTLARSTTSLGDDGSPAVTWNGNYVESPATHFSSTTGNDMSGDLGHRLVTTGAAGVSLTIEGDPVAAETGSAMWVVQGLVPGTTVVEADGSSSGVATVASLAAAIWNGITAAAGLAASAMAGAVFWLTVATAPGVATGSAASATVLEAVGASAGVAASAVSGALIVATEAASVGVATGDAEGVDGASSGDGIASGTATVSGVGAATAESEASAGGTSTVLASAATISPSEAASAGLAAAPGVGTTVHASVGGVSGSGAASAAAESLALTLAESAGAAVVAGAGEDGSGGSQGLSNGTSTASAVSDVVVQPALVFEDASGSRYAFADGSGARYAFADGGDARYVFESESR